jgi:chemotaxis protein methyltransferase CheR
MDGYDEFTLRIKNLCQIDLNSYKEKQMKRRIESLIRKNGFDNYNSYYDLLKVNKKHLQEFLGYITINVSEFFRNPLQWDVLETEIIPELMSSKASIKIWSSACASGEEPYSIALMLKKKNFLEKAQIFATDIDDDALNAAKEGVYTKKSLTNVQKNLIKLYFIDKGNDFFEINDEIKKKVAFKRLNLLEDNFPGHFDLILCRNVMIYFTEAAKEKLYFKFFNSLSERGIFFVGSTEQIIMPQKYGFTGIRNFFYQKT